MRALRPHQSDAIGQLRRSLARGKRRPMLMAPTGAGKTVLAAAVIDLARSKGKRVIFTVPAIELIDQTAREFWKEGIRDVGVIQADHPMTDPSKPVQIASVQTLQRRKIPQADLVIIDEAHRQFGLIGDWMGREEWAKVPFIGLSATPWSKGLGKLYDDLIVAATTGELIEKGFLSRFKVYAPSHPDLSGVRTVAGDYQQDELSEAMSRGTLTADIVQTWLRLGEGRPTLCFGVDRTHAKTIQQQFEASGVPCGYVDALTPKDEREAVRKRFAAGEIRVVCNVGVLTTGVDWDVRCIILARPTKSEILYTQIIGRGLRTADGKDECLILDHSDTTLRLGFVTEIHHEAMDDGTGAKAQRREFPPAKPKECPKCHYVRAPKVRACPSCGHVAEVSTQVETQDGDLAEVNGSNRKADMTEKVVFIRQLKAYALGNGKRDGWVSHKYREKFGVWPNHPSLTGARPADSVSPEVGSWIRSRNIAWAKSQQRSREGNHVPA